MTGARSVLAPPQTPQERESTRRADERWRVEQTERWFWAEVERRRRDPKLCAALRKVVNKVVRSPTPGTGKPSEGRSFLTTLELVRTFTAVEIFTRFERDKAAGEGRRFLVGKAHARAAAHLGIEPRTLSDRLKRMKSELTKDGLPRS